MKKKLVFLTGATGDMGFSALQKLAENLDQIHLRILVRDSEKNRKKLAPYAEKVEIVWGDLKDDEKLRQCVKDADIVLHPGAFISPRCDDVPEEAFRVNYGSTLSMLKSIKELGQSETTRFVYVGSCAMTGDRMPPVHWGRVGDPMKPSIYDYYALTKVKSEFAVLESGLKYFASCRLGAMLSWKEGDSEYPIISHQNYNNPLEWSTVDDCGNLLRNICINAPEAFWGHVYNIGGGADFRQTMASLSMSGQTDTRNIYDPEWLALHNFHGQWYLDSDELERIVPHRMQSYRDAIEKLYYLGPDTEWGTMPAMTPARAEALKAVKESNYQAAHKPGGTLRAIEDGDDERIKVWYGSREKFEAIPRDWDRVVISRPLPLLPRKPLSRGFDETKPAAELDLTDMQEAAKFRGGECLSPSMEKGDLYTPLLWRSADGYEFKACPYTVLFAGHWSPDDLRREWRYGHMAKTNPFFAQVWTPLHQGEDDDFRVKMITDGSDVEAKYL